MEHLSRALIGEVFIAKAKEGPKAGNPFAKGVEAVSDEIAALIEGMDIQSARTMLKAIIWSGFLNEMERVETRRIQAN